MLPLLALLAAAPADAAWPTACGDARRTCQAEVDGPATGELAARIVVDDGLAVDTPLVVGADGGVWFGSRGVVRAAGASDPSGWAVGDGVIFKADATLASAWSWEAPPVPACDEDPGALGPGALCGEGDAPTGLDGGFTAAVTLSADGTVAYVGRHDGTLTALDAADGQVLWTFRTGDPAWPDDPGRGGRVVGAPLALADGRVLFATAGVGPRQTHAVYALDADGALLWRFPDQGSAPAGFWAPLALSPDGEVAYAGSGWAPAADPLDRSVPGTLIALDLGAAVEEGAAPVAWRLELVDAGAIATPPVWPTRLAVGADGAVFVGGRAPFPLGADGGAAVVGRVEDLGDEGRVGWSSWVTLDPGGASWVPALALRERNGATERVIAAGGGERTGGAYASVGWIEALHPDTGAPLWDAPFDPSAFGRAGAPSGLAIGADGLVYASITGRAAGGAVVAISESGGLVWEAAVAGLLEGGAPAIGPDGTLYVGDARPCALSWAPIELGLCDANRVDPEVLAFREAGAVDPIAFPEASACEGCAAGGGSGAAWLGLIALGWTRRRRG